MKRNGVSVAEDHSPIPAALHAHREAREKLRTTVGDLRDETPTPVLGLPTPEAIRAHLMKAHSTCPECARLAAAIDAASPKR